MSEISQELLDYQQALRRAGHDPAPLAAQAEALAASPEDGFGDAETAFHHAANAHEYVGDSDYGALLVEVLADACADPPRRARLYATAAARAGVFASWATAGGEGLARSVDVERIAAKRAQVR
jgi:hypothetical protein